MIQLYLPYPPTINHYYGRTQKGRVYIKPDGVAFRNKVCLIVQHAQVCRLAGRVEVEVAVYPPDRRERDLDNLEKALFDGLQHGGVYAKDSQIKRKTSEMFEPDDKGGHVVVRLYGTEIYSSDGEFSDAERRRRERTMIHRATSESVCEHFSGIMIDVKDPLIGDHQVPGWQCKYCGWRVGSRGFPPIHECPEAGERQRQKRKRKRT